MVSLAKRCQYVPRWVFLLVFICGCESFVSSEKQRVNSADSTAAIPTKPISKVNEMFADTLHKAGTDRSWATLESLFDWLRYKKAHGGAHSSPQKKDTLLYDNGFGHYYYFYFNRHHGRPAGLPGRSDFEVATAAKKPITAAEQFLSVEETVVKISCRIKDPLLQQFDLVGLTMHNLEKRLGDRKSVV